MASDRLPSGAIMRSLRAMMDDIGMAGRGAATGAREMLESGGGRAMTLGGGMMGAASGALSAGANDTFMDDPLAEAGQGGVMGGVAGLGAGAGLAALAGGARGATSARALRMALRQALEQSGEMGQRGARPISNRMQLLGQLRELEQQRAQIGDPPPAELQDQAAQMDMMIMTLRQQLRGA